MHRTNLAALLVAALAITLAGCGGGGGDGAGAPPPPPPGGGAGAAEYEVGPLVVRTAAATGFTTQSLPNPLSMASVVALYGAKIDYLASTALLDRIVFASDRDGNLDFDIWVCNLDGSGLTQVTVNDAAESEPAWSPDGTRIAFARAWPASDKEIICINADGSSPTALTNNSRTDGYPHWSADGSALVYETNPSGNWEVFWMFANGSGQTNLSNNAALDDYPCWSPNLEDPKIVFSSTRAGGRDLWVMDEDGASPTALTTTAYSEFKPMWDADGDNIVYERSWWGSDIFAMDAQGNDQHSIVHHPDDQYNPCWSSDGKFVAFDDSRGPSMHIFLKQTGAPYATFKVTSGPRNHRNPHLGSPTVQTERVLIGPAGSDWGGKDPLWSDAYAGICAFNHEGYLNFVRIGVAAADADTVEVTPLPDPGQGLNAGVIEARAIANLREDAGRGKLPTVWAFAPPYPTAIATYFYYETGKLVGVIVLRDSALPAGDGAAPAITHCVEAGRTVAAGSFAAVYDAWGHNLAPDGATRVVFGANGQPQDVQ